MAKLNLNQKIESLNNSLKYFNFPTKYFIFPADKRLGSKFSLASNTEHGGISTHTSFMTFEEFNAWFMGYLAATNKKF